jgi:RNA-directed DNA polymerase
MSKEVEPPSVGSSPRQGGEARRDWSWAEPSVWTDRMLTALENGVKGGRWFSLMDKVYSPKNLRVAWEKVRHNRGSAGVDRQSVQGFERNAEKYLEELHSELKSQQYRPQPVRRQWIPKPGGKKMRPLGIPAVRDRIVQTALRNVLEPIWERRFVEQSHGFRPGRGCKDALREVDRLLKAGHGWVVDADIQSYFDTIDHGILMEQVSREVSDGAVLALLENYLKQGVMDGTETWTPTQGTPQGAVVSPLLANIYLHPVDQAVVGAGQALVRYADDLVILCRTEQEAKEALGLLETEMSRRGLKLHPEKTRLVEAGKSGGFDFLGYHFERGKRWARKRSVAALKERVRERTRRANGKSLEAIIQDLNGPLRGWFEYFKHSHRYTFEKMDKWVRMRLRSILRSRQKRKGIGRGPDHWRWPNSYFQTRGLFTMLAAFAALRQSRRG